MRIYCAEMLSTWISGCLLNNALLPSSVPTAGVQHSFGQWAAAQQCIMVLLHHLQHKKAVVTQYNVSI